MRIEVEAKLILTVPELKKEDDAGDIVLAAEQHINQDLSLLVLSESKTQVGVRIHVGDFKTTD